jgi:hypothetical protein
MNEEDKILKLKSWFLEAIDNFRIEYNKLTPDQKRNILNDNDYNSPCQIELFWISEPFDFQMFVKTHDPRRDDKEIFINGPFTKFSFKSEIIKIMGEDRWENVVPYKPSENRFPVEMNVGFEKRKYSDYLVDSIYMLYWYLENPSVQNYDYAFLSGEMICDKDYVRFIKGNVADFKSPIEFVHEIIKSSINTTSQENLAKSFNNKLTPKEKTTELQYMGAYYYPLLRIGDDVELPFSQRLSILLGDELFYPCKDFEFNFCGKKLFCDTFGFLAIQVEADNKDEDDEILLMNIEIEKQNEIAKILNTIFGVSLICGYGCLSVKPSELVVVKENTYSSQLFVSSWNYIDTKRPLNNTRYGHRKNQIKIDSMEQIIKVAETIYNHKELDDLLLYLESYTHYYNSEYSQSFLYSWFIIEKFIVRRFKEMLSEKKITGDRKEKFNKHDKWTSESRIEVLNIAGKLSTQEYDIISNYNTRRNHFVHKGKPISKEEAKDLLELSEGIITERVKIMIENKI